MHNKTQIQDIISINPMYEAGNDDEQDLLIMHELHCLRQDQRKDNRVAALMNANRHPAQGWWGYTWVPELYLLNWRAGMWHLMLAIIMIGLNFALNPPFVLELNRSWSTPNIASLPSAVQNNTCCLGDGAANCRVYDDVYEWFECIRPAVEEWRSIKIENENDVPLYQPTLTQVTNPIPLINLIILFELITSACHLWIYTQDGGALFSSIRGKDRFYSNNLKNLLNPHRWLEYAVTASIMLLASLSLSRVSDVFLLTSLFINSFFLNFVGGNCFELLYLGQRKLPEHFAELFRAIKWICFFSSWCCFIINIVTYWDAYRAIVEPYTELELTGELWGQLFGFVSIANWAITVDFCVFPIIHLYQFAWPFWRSEKQEIEAYIRGERGFIWASFLSKTILTAIIGSAALMRNDRN